MRQAAMRIRERKGKETASAARGKCEGELLCGEGRRPPGFICIGEWRPPCDAVPNVFFSPHCVSCIVVDGRQTVPKTRTTPASISRLIRRRPPRRRRACASNAAKWSYGNAIHLSDLLSTLRRNSPPNSQNQPYSPILLFVDVLARKECWWGGVCIPANVSKVTTHWYSRQVALFFALLPFCLPLFSLKAPDCKEQAQGQVTIFDRQP